MDAYEAGPDPQYHVWTTVRAKLEASGDLTEGGREESPDRHDPAACIKEIGVGIGSGSESGSLSGFVRTDR